MNYCLFHPISIYVRSTESDMCESRVKFDKVPRVSSATSLRKLCGTSRTCDFRSCRRLSLLWGYRPIVCERYEETRDSHPSRRNIPLETRGSRPTADGTLTEKTSKRRRDGRAACKASRGGGGGGGGGGGRAEGAAKGVFGLVHHHRRHRGGY